MGIVQPFRAAASALLERYRFARQHGLSFGGARDLYEVLGYERELGTRNYRDRYYRGGIAKRIVDVYPNATWRGTMELIEDEDPKVSTPFETAWEELEKKHQLQAKLHRTDKLSSLSTYAILLIGAPGELDTELKKGKPEQLLYFRPAIGGGGPVARSQGQAIQDAVDASATIASYDEDPKSPRFGLPQTYQLRLAENMPTTIGMKPVHWTRVVHVAEGCLEDDIFGIPTLESVWNLLDDLDKVTGGGAEAFWLRANQGLHLDIDKDMALADANAAKEALKEEAEKYKHQLTRWLRTRGVSAEVLGSDVANFAAPADAIITQIAGAKGIPKRILTGSEMGELASSQDRENWRDQVVGRQKGFAGPYVVRPLVDRLIAYGYLPTPSGGADAYEVRWPNISILTEDERQKGAASWAATATAGEGPVFTNAEIRDKWYEMEPLEPEEQKAIQAAPPLAPGTEVNEDGKVVEKSELKKKAEEEEDEEDGEDGEVPEKRAAQELIRVLEDAIEAKNTDVIDRILGLDEARALGGPGSGHFGHEGRPGKVGGSLPGDQFPTGLTKVGGAMGSNPGGVYKDPSGQKWYVKNYRDPEQAYGEHLSNGIYAAAGVNAPISVLGEKGQYASKWLNDIKGTVQSEGLTPEIANKILDGFALDVFLSNWDTVGLTRDNIAVHGDGSVTRIDQGGTLLHRAQGALKPEVALNTLTEWNFFSTSNREYRDVFKAAGVKDGNALGKRVVEQIDRIIAARPYRDPHSGRGGWREFVEERVPQAPDAWKQKVSRVLETRHDLLLVKRSEVLNAARGVTFNPREERMPVVLNPREKRIPVVLNPKEKRIPVVLNPRKERRHLGGPGSGFYGHAGRPGQIGGSAPATDAEILARPSSYYEPLDPDGYDTQQRFKNWETGKYTPARRQLHTIIRKEMVGDATPVGTRATGYVMGGGWASGKSTLLKTGMVSIPKNHVKSDGDLIKSYLPEYKENLGKDPAVSNNVHEESSDLAKSMIPIAAEWQYNVVLDGTGNSSLDTVRRKVQTMRDGGLAVKAHYVTVDTETAIMRARKRGQESGRFVPEQGLRESHAKVSQIFPKLMAEGLFDEATLWDTNDADIDRGIKPEKVASSIGAKVTIHNPAKWARFLAKAGEKY